MKNALACLAVCLLLAPAAKPADAPRDPSMWTIYITNDNCPDYTWGFTEEQTRRAFADIVRAHLDEMKRTDAQDPPNRDRYNMAVTQEALCFLARYPDREAELVRRIKQGRLYLSPYLCNTLWAFQGFEGAVRSFYPARRLEKRWGISIDVAEHIEQPSLPWGVASILAGCGIGWLSVPYYGYDSTFGGLKNPPLFILEGADGSRVRVILDRWACGKASYTQGGHLLRNPQAHVKQWLGHYRKLGKAYPPRVILASGTHGDLSPHSGRQVRGFAEAIIKYNARPGPHPKLVNAALPQFCKAVDEAQSAKPFLPVVRGCFGHSWDLWPVCLAKYAADLREGRRRFLAAEALLAVAAHGRGEIHQASREDRRRAEWCWAMLADHAWNGTDEKNKRHNADLRRKWSRQFNRLGQSLLRRGWAALGLQPDANHITIFNPLSVPRAGLVRIAAPPAGGAITCEGRQLATQVVTENGQRVLYFVSPEVGGFGFRQCRLSSGPAAKAGAGRLRAAARLLESPYYRLAIDPRTGGVSSLVHKPTETELVAPGARRSLCQTVYFDGKEHTPTNVKSEVVADGPVLARLRVRGAVAGIKLTNFVTVYADLDRVDFDLRIDKPIATQKQRLCHVFPILRDQAVLRLDTTAAVVRPRPQPQGDLLPGADRRRFAVQGFVDASPPKGVGVTVAPLDAFALRLDLAPITFEALGNDQNYREVVQDQHGVRRFRFRYALRAHGGGYKNAEAFSWSRAAASPLLATAGRVDGRQGAPPAIRIDPARAIATCLKPADGGPGEGLILRLREVAAKSTPVRVGLRGFKQAVQTDLLERDRKRLRIIDAAVSVRLEAHGFAALRLLP